VEWLDDVSGWKAGDAAATERLREYVTPFVHGAVLAQWPHHQTNARMGQVLDEVMAAQQQVKLVEQFVQVAVAIARKVSKGAPAGGRQERPTTDPTVSEGRQWLERVRTLPEARRERVLWRLTEGISGPELCEVLGLSADEVRVDLERGLGATMVPAQSLVGVDYVWDLSSEPTTALARLETWATSLRFDALAAPEPDDAAQNGATFEDLSSLLEAARVQPEANPFSSAERTAMPRVLLRSPSSASFDEKTHGGFDLPAAARGLVPKVDASPAPRSAARAAMVIPGPERRREDGPRPTLPSPHDERPRPSRPRGAEAKPDEERSNRARNPELTARDEDDARPGRSRIAAAPLKAREDSGRKRNPELEHRRQAARTALSHDAPLIEPVSAATPVGPVSEPSIEPTDPERAPSARARALVIEPVPRPVPASSRLVWLTVVALLLLAAVAWRVGVL